MSLMEEDFYVKFKRELKGNEELKSVCLISVIIFNNSLIVKKTLLRIEVNINPLGLTGQLFCPIDFKRYPHHV